MPAQYAMSSQLDMIPMMMAEGYKARGWLGIILGSRLWYGFYPSGVASDAAFEEKMNALARGALSQSKID
eukprot:COSAG01_NODE_67058_length_268_cov_0.615385_1_plen_69_part_10